MDVRICLETLSVDASGPDCDFVFVFSFDLFCVSVCVCFVCRLLVDLKESNKISSIRKIF